MSDGERKANGRRALEELAAARRRSDLVSGLRGLARRSGTSRSRAQDSGAGPESGPAGNTGTPAAASGDERCELCGAPLAADHRHLLHLGERRIVCACETCWSARSGDPEFRPAGARTEWLEDFEMPDEAWASFQIPIGLAFFMRTGAPERIVAFYPSPAGATESEIDDAAWHRLEEADPRLERLEPDCEALIANRISSPHEYAVAPIDECYRLVGMIRSSWEGISGGRGPEEAIRRFFAELRVRGAMAVRSDG